MTQSLAQQVASGKIRALARAITIIENEQPEKLELMTDLYAHAGRAYVMGITGSPGGGKSTLVNQLISHLRKQDKTVGVIAVDPTSPFSGGAILGDRVRMSSHFTDSGVYIRSMGTRGSLGGLARATKEAVVAMDAYGFDVVLVETVGVGQSELDVMKISDTVSLVLTPGSGDVVQVFKAGIMEVADLFIINKSDLPGASKLKAQINSLLDLPNIRETWRPPVVKVSAAKAEGLDELWKACLSHRRYLQDSGEGHRRRLLSKKDEIADIVHHEMKRHIQEKLDGDAAYTSITEVAPDPYSAARDIIRLLLDDSNDKEGSP